MIPDGLIGTRAVGNFFNYQVPIPRVRTLLGQQYSSCQDTRGNNLRINS